MQRSDGQYLGLRQWQWVGEGRRGWEGVESGGITGAWNLAACGRISQKNQFVSERCNLFDLKNTMDSVGCNCL